MIRPRRALAIRQNIICRNQSGLQFRLPQFYDQKGNVSYALYSQTITCSAACASLRLTPDPSLPAGAAQTCLSGGTWDGTQGGCVYKALTSESSVCSAGDNGCSDFSGNGGANSQTIFNDTLKILLTIGVLVLNNPLLRLPAAIHCNFPDQLQKIAAFQLTKGSAYNLSFLADGNGGNVTITASAGSSALIIPSRLPADLGVYIL